MLMDWDKPITLTDNSASRNAGYISLQFCNDFTETK